ncbi:MAG: LysR substrate-binding domain-containing protein [Gammaproteobacteria bacterium]
MNLTLRQFRAFVEVARAGSFTAAASALHLTQSAVSATVRELESQLGLAVLDRTTRRVTLTESGTQLLQVAERVLRDVDSAVTEAKGLLDKSRGHVVVAASPLAAATLLPQMIAGFSQVYPKVTIELHDVLTDQILHSVRGGTADIGIGTFEKSHTELELSTLYEDVLGVVLPSTHRLARHRSLRWRQLSGEPLIALGRSSAFRPLIDSVMSGQGIGTGEVRFEVGYMGTAVALVEAGLGLSVLPERAAALIKSNAARFRRLTAPVVSRPVTLVTRAGRSLSPAASAFVTFLSSGTARKA